MMCLVFIGFRRFAGGKWGPGFVALRVWGFGRIEGFPALGSRISCGFNRKW